jgi:GNAT superfamily N-acetyltransferase
MENGEKNMGPILSHAEPVLAVRNLPETIEYWQKVLGFPGKWMWGDPPTNGGVSWQKVFIQFHHAPELAETSVGNVVWIRVQHLELLYDVHQKNMADIVEPLECAAYGFSRYILRDNNGYLIHFAGMYSEREKSKQSLPANIKIIARIPTEKESSSLASAVGWSSPAKPDNDKVGSLPIVFAVIAENILTGEIVGSALLLGDHRSFYYVKDVVVHPDWQGKRIGSALMMQIKNWLDKNGADNALVGLFAKETLEPFYQQFGFMQAFAMLRYIERGKE